MLLAIILGRILVGGGHMSINSRIKILRKDLKLTLAKFGKHIEMSESNLSRIEKSERAVTDKNIKLICSEFNVNEDWLRTGEGEMYKSPIEGKEDKLIELAALITYLEDEGAQEVIDRILHDDRCQKLAKTLFSLEEPFFSMVEENIYATKKHSDG